jgi:hypothetical protein
LGAVKLASSRETVPTPVVTAIALVEVRLSRESFVNDSTVNSALPLDGVPNELLDADAGVALDLTGSILVL